MMRRTILLLGGLLALGACGGSPSEPQRRANQLVADSAALFRTDSASYTFTRSSFGTWGHIRATLTNASGRTMYFVKCNGATSLSLQRLDGNRWTPFWSPAMNLCLSPPITVRPGGTHTFEIRIFGGTPGSNRYPQFDAPLVTGAFRVVWHDAYFSYQDRLPWGEPVPEALRRSNSFVIVAP